MDDEGSHLTKSSARIRLFETEGSNGLEENEVPVRSPVVGSGVDDGASKQKESQQLSATEKEVDDTGRLLEVVANTEAAADGLGTHVETASSSANVKLTFVINAGGSDDLHCQAAGDESILLMPDSSAQLDLKANQSFVVDRENRKTEEKQLDLPSFEGDSLNLHDRDPSYATQRPDTLGAINLVPQNPVTVTAVNRTFQNVNLKTGARFHGIRQDNAPEDMIFDMVQLGRRTRGAGMDQVELNQHHLVVGSDDGSDSGDAAEPDSNQCESTEADQYKMNPEADQSESVRSDYAQEPLGAFSRTTRNGSRAVGLVRPGRNLEQNDERFQIGDDVDDEEEYPEASEVTEEDDQDWQRINDQDLGERAEDDRQYSIADYTTGSTTSGSKVPLPGGWQVRNDTDVAAASVSLHTVQLRQHPNSAFSQLKPDGIGCFTEGSSSTLNASGPGSSDRRPINTDMERKLNVVLSSHDQPMSKPAAVFKPILHESKMNSTNDNRRKGQFPRQHSEGYASDSVSGFRYGAVAKHGKTLSDNGLRSQTDRDDAIVPSPRLLTSNPSFEVGSSDSLHSLLPSRADHLMIGEPNNGLVVGSSTKNNYQQNHQPSTLLCHPLPMGCNYEPQVTPKKQTRSSYNIIDDGLELSPIRPPSSHTSQQPHLLGFIHSPGLASVTDPFQGTAAATDQHARLQSCGYKTSSNVSSEINDIQEFRSHLFSLLMLSDRTMPDKSSYDQTNDVDELLTSNSGPLVHDQPSAWNLTGLHEALPLSSKYLLSGASQVKLDVAGLAAENRALLDAMEQQRYKRKHCEKQIQQLQNKVLELQQNLAVAVSIDRKKDLTIEQLDKALVKVAEGWHQKEAERHEALVFLQKDNAALKQALDSQQQITSRLEMQLNHALQQLHMEQQRAAQLGLSKDQHISELTLQCQRLELTLDSEKEKWQQKLDNVQREAEKMKEKMQFQLEELKAAREEDVETWKEKERDNLLKLEQVKETHSKIIELEKAKLDRKDQANHDLELVLQATQTELEQLQLECETIMREKESLKVEMGLMEARHLGSLHQLEAELQTSSDKKLTAKLDELNFVHVENERKLQASHHLRLQELTQHHVEELEQLKDEHQAVVTELEQSFYQQQQLKESCIKELEKQLIALEEEKQTIEIRKADLAAQLQSMMQSHCEEALRLLCFNQLSSNQLTNASSVGKQRSASSLAAGNYADNSRCFFADKETSEIQQSLKETVEQDDNVICRHQAFPSNEAENEECSRYPSGIQLSASPVCWLKGNDTKEFAAAASVAVTQMDSSSRYSQFLASVRSYQPLLADLNASVASVINSVSNFGQTCQGVSLEGDILTLPEAETSLNAVARTESSHHVSFQKNPITSHVTQVQYPRDGQLITRSEVPSNDGSIYLYSPLHPGENLVPGHKHQVEIEQNVVPFDQSRDNRSPSASSFDNQTDCNRVERSVNFCDDQRTSLFSQILQHDMSNTSEESATEYKEEMKRDSGDCMNNRLQQQEQRQQQLHHYIRMLLQRSPRVTTEDETPVSGVVFNQEDNMPANKQVMHNVRSDNRLSEAVGNKQLRLNARLSSPEQDLQLNEMPRDRQRYKPSDEILPTMRDTNSAKSNHIGQPVEIECSSTSQAGNFLSQKQLVEIRHMLEQYKLAEVSPVSPSSFPLQMNSLPMDDLLGYLQSISEQSSECRIKRSELMHGPCGTKGSPSDLLNREEVPPRNHPSHPINKELVGVSEATNVKQESTKLSKFNKTESMKPKNVVSASKTSSKKDRAAFPRNSNKNAAWK